VQIKFMYFSKSMLRKIVSIGQTRSQTKRRREPANPCDDATTGDATTGQNFGAILPDLRRSFPAPRKSRFYWASAL
jgi:hypothetical protein